MRWTAWHKMYRGRVKSGEYTRLTYKVECVQRVDLWLLELSADENAIPCCG